MTTLEEAARDALELCERIIEGKRIWSLSDMRVVSAVLREALKQAEPVVEPTFSVRTGCRVCGVGDGGKAMGYVCPRSDCPMNGKSK